MSGSVQGLGYCEVSGSVDVQGYCEVSGSVQGLGYCEDEWVCSGSRLLWC